MPTIAIVDDRKDDRETIGRVVQSTLKKLKEDKSWTLISDEPPLHERDVLQWLDENDATVLVTDWKLNEGARGKRVVNYEADRLIHEVRSKRPTFPIFVITGFESEAQAHLKDVENIFSRQHFTKNAETVIPQMLRAGLRRYEEQHDLMSTMDRLARKVAIGKSTKSERKQLQSLQGYFQAELSTVINVDTVLEEIETAKQKADALRKKVEQRIKKRKR